jgi:3-dehydroquinate dehydratase/shikimate dehydrogenase
MVATVRRPPDGGKWDGSEDARLMLIRQCVVNGFDWIDLEHDVIDKVPRFGKVRRIVSYHNLREMPAELEKIHARMCTQEAYFTCRVDAGWKFVINAAGDILLEKV